MLGRIVEIHGVQIFEISALGSELRDAQDAVDLMSAASQAGAEWIAIPVERLGDGFFELRSGIAGELAQKFVTYRAKVVIVGTIGPRIAASHSLAAFVAESNQGSGLWFVESWNELGHRLNGLSRR